MPEQLELLISKEFLSSREDSPAPTQASAGKSSENKLVWLAPIPPFGGTCCEFVASYCPSTSSWKTRQGLLLTPTESETFLGDWPASGTMQDLTLYRVRRSVPHTLGLEFLSSHTETFPTPTARDYRSGKGWKDTGHTPQLPEVLGGTVNPEFVEWLQGFPIGWTELDA